MKKFILVLVALVGLVSGTFAETYTDSEAEYWTTDESTDLAVCLTYWSNSETSEDRTNNKKIAEILDNSAVYMPSATVPKSFTNRLFETINREYTSLVNKNEVYLFMVFDNSTELRYWVLSIGMGDKADTIFYGDLSQEE